MNRHRFSLWLPFISLSDELCHAMKFFAGMRLVDSPSQEWTHRSWYTRGILGHLAVSLLLYNYHPFTVRTVFRSIVFERVLDSVTVSLFTRWKKPLAVSVSSPRKTYRFPHILSRLLSVSSLVDRCAMKVRLGRCSSSGFRDIDAARTYRDTRGTLGHALNRSCFFALLESSFCHR